MVIWTDWAIWMLLIIAAYLFGSVPAAYLVARARGIDIRKQGTQQVGGGNLWRLTSRKLGLMVGIFDFLKGILMVWITSLQGFNAGQQLVVGLATIVGHNWPVFLRFHGGRGAATTLGLVIILPVLNDISWWPSVIAIGIVVVFTIILRSSPLPVLVSAASLPLTSWLFGGENAVIVTFLVIFLIIVVKRLTAQSSAEAATISKGRLFLNRLLFDRDIADRSAWVYRKHVPKKEKT
jgi:glycerol-3-phosphate acyltransferase PlsY